VVELLLLPVCDRHIKILSQRGVCEGRHWCSCVEHGGKPLLWFWNCKSLCKTGQVNTISGLWLPSELTLVPVCGCHIGLWHKTTSTEVGIGVALSGVWEIPVLDMEPHV
jgi:hypothetical protein